MAAQVWMLFESGNATEVVLNPHLNSDKDTRPINAYLTVECNRSFTRAALRGAEVAYTWARKRDPELKPQTISYDLKGLADNCSLTGESGGLAFALALASHLVGNNSLPVAATGEIMASADGGPIKRIEGINEKLVAAATLLPEGGWIFYPKDNDSEITEEVHALVNKMKLSIHAIKCVDEALQLLFSKEEEQELKQPATVIKQNKLSPKCIKIVAGSLTAAALLGLTTLIVQKTTYTKQNVKATIVEKNSIYQAKEVLEHTPVDNHKIVRLYQEEKRTSGKRNSTSQLESDETEQQTIDTNTITSAKENKTGQLVEKLEKTTIKRSILDKGFD